MRTAASKNIIVYRNAAMNDVHAAHIEKEYLAGRISILENYHDIHSPSANAKVQSSAAKVIAQKLLEQVVQ